MAKSAAQLQKEYHDNPLIAHIDAKKYGHAASEALVKKAVDGLTKAGFTVHLVATKAEALKVLEGIAPEGATVSTGNSTGLHEVGFTDFLKDTKKYKNFKALSLAEKDQGKSAELTREGYSADYFFASPNAIGTDGVLVAADLTGTKVAGFLPSKNLVLLSGTNKIVEGGKAEALERLYKYVLPMESLRAHLVYGVPASAANNVVVISGENPWGAKRIHLVLVKEVLGF